MCCQPTGARWAGIELARTLHAGKATDLPSDCCRVGDRRSRAPSNRRSRAPSDRRCEAVLGRRPRAAVGANPEPWPFGYGGVRELVATCDRPQRCAALVFSSDLRPLRRRSRRSSVGSFFTARSLFSAANAAGAIARSTSSLSRRSVSAPLATSPSFRCTSLHTTPCFLA